MRIPAVQNWGAQKIAAYISKDLNTEVSVQGFGVEWFDNLDIQGLTILDLDRDTFVNAKSLVVNFDQIFKGLESGVLPIEGARLEDALVNLTFKKDNEKGNAALLFGQNKSDEPKEKGNPILLDLNKLELVRTRIVNDHEVKGKRENFYVHYGLLDDLKMNLEPLSFDCERAYFEKPDVRIQNFLYDEKRFEELFVTPYIGIEDLFPFDLDVEEIQVVDGAFQLNNFRKSPERNPNKNEIDWRHFDVFDIQIDGANLKMKNWEFGGDLYHLSFKERSGFQLREGKADNFFVTENKATADNLLLHTSESRIEGDLEFKYKHYPSFKNFTEEIFIDMRSRKTSIAVEDLLQLAPKLKNNKFFVNNKQKDIEIDGRIVGRVNSLKTRDIYINVDDRITIQGNVDVRDVTNSDVTRINLELSNFETHISTIETLIPSFKPPKEFYNLGNIKVQGTFQGLYKDFVAQGSVFSDVGSASFTTKLDIVDGAEKAIYFGDFNLSNFDVGKWTGNPKIGKLSMNARVEEGYGMTMATANAKLQANIKSFVVNDYNYSNASLNGSMNKRHFEGKFNIADPNVDLSFIGRLDLVDSIPHIDADGRINVVNLKALNLTKFPLKISGDFNADIKDINPEKFTGNLGLYNFSLESEDNLMKIDSFVVVSKIVEDSIKRMTIDSDIADIDLLGKFRLLQLPNTFMNLLHRNNPSFANKLNLPFKENLPQSDFDFNFDVYSSRGIFSVFPVDLDTLKDLHLNGHIDDFKEMYHLEGHTPRLAIENMEFKNLNVYSDGEGPYHNIVVSHEGMQIGNTKLQPLNVFFDLEKDSLYFVFNEVNTKSFFDQINVEGKLYIFDDDYRVQLYNSNLQLFGDEWNVDERNFIQLGKNQIWVDNLALLGDSSSLKLESTNNKKGLRLDVSKLNLEDIWLLVNYENVKPSGQISGFLSTQDIKNWSILNADLHVPNIKLNDDEFGELSIDIQSDKINEPIKAFVDLVDEDKRLNARATVELPKKLENFLGHIDGRIDIENYPLFILEYFIRNGLSETAGTADGEIVVVGPLNDPNIYGELFIPQGEFKVDITGTKYFVDNQKVKVTTDEISFDQVIISDRYGNQAIVDGALTHHNLARFGVQANVTSPEILVLDTYKDYNPLFYGHVLAKANADFNGPINAPTIVVQAENKTGSEFTINNDYEKTVGALDYIQFVQDTVNAQNQIAQTVTGVDFKLFMNVQPSGHFELIFDESTRDIISANGSGDLVFNYDRSGNISLEGIFAIDRGNYHFTYSDGFIPISKNFTIGENSFIEWFGDPYNADLNIVAQYANARAAPYNLVADQVSSDELLKNEAKQKTNIVLKTSLQGSLWKPDISFDIDIPNLTGSLKSIVDQRLEELNDNPNELYLQSGSLIAFGDFTNSTDAQSINSGVAVFANTLSEWLSNQISFYFEGIIQNVVQELGIEFIDDIEFDLEFVLPNGEYIETSTFNINNSGAGAGARISMFNRRVELNLSGDYVNNSSSNALIPADYVNTDVEIFYILTSDRRWRLRAYTRNDYASLGRRNKTGIGITWRREYDKLEDFKRELKFQTEKKPKKRKDDF